MQSTGGQVVGGVVGGVESGVEGGVEVRVEGRVEERWGGRGRVCAAPPGRGIL